jgi:hypothetical protein
MKPLKYINKMNLEKLSKEELISIKKNIDLQLINIDRKEKEENLNTIIKYEKLSQIIQFHLDKMYQMDFVNITFSSKSKNGYTNYSTKHDTKPMGCSASIINEDLDGHCFLYDFGEQGSNYYFYTLNPNTWEKDLKIESEKKIKRIEERYSNQIKIEKERLNELLQNKEVINDFIKDLKIK